MVTATAPTEYPVEVHIGYFLNKDKKLICGVPKTGLLQAGWQGYGAEGGQGGSEIPSHLTLTYVAYAEKKFYEVDTDLPSEKFLEVFRKGYNRIDHHNNLVHETLYDIREYSQGRNNKGRMNPKSEDIKYMELIGNLRDALKILADKIKPKVYEYWFLKN